MLLKAFSFFLAKNYQKDLLYGRSLKKRFFIPAFFQISINFVST